MRASLSLARDTIYELGRFSVLPCANSLAGSNEAFSSVIVFTNFSYHQLGAVTY
jgi:hypothetical protein